MTDISITNNGGFGFFCISANTRKGKTWLRRNVPDQQDGTAYSDDRRCAWDIYQGALTDGLAVSA